MTIRYLNYTASISVANGNGTLSISPPSGQFWIPRMVRLGVNYPDQTFYPVYTQQYLASLYHGGVGDKNVDAFVDGTGCGSGDVTSVLNGTLIQTGEYLTADWNILDLGTHHTPLNNGTGYMQVVGLTADSIAEVTDILATAAPGPRFQTPLPNTMQIPQAPSAGAVAIFNNPGQGNSVQLYSANPLYIYTVSILTNGVLVNGDGALQPSATDNTWQFAYYNPGNAGNDTPLIWDFHGMRLDLGGLWWVQKGNGAVNSIAYAINFTYRAMSI